MKSVKQFVFALLFVSVLAINTFAGDLETPGFVPPPPPPPDRSMYTIKTETTPTGPESVISTGDVAETSDQLFYDALMAMLSLF